MTSGGYSKAEAWNLQLQGRVRELEADLAEAEKLLLSLTKPENLGDREFVLGRAFLKKMDVKRVRRTAIAKDIEAIISSGRDGRKP